MVVLRWARLSLSVKENYHSTVTVRAEAAGWLVHLFDQQLIYLGLFE